MLAHLYIGSSLHGGSEKKLAQAMRNEMAKSEQTNKLVEKVDSTYMRPTDFADEVVAYAQGLRFCESCVHAINTAAKQKHNLQSIQKVFALAVFTPA
jgi:hypothetical protein